MLYCIVTASASELAEGDIHHYLRSVAGQEASVILILRGVDEATALRYRGDTRLAAVLQVPSGGISAVRNLGLRYLHALQLSPLDIVSFPDDDCQYPENFVKRVQKEFERTDADLLVGSYGESQISPIVGTRLGVRDAAFRSSSVALFARWSLIQRVGGFNESLGVGSGVFEYGEDNDFALRALGAARQPIYNPSLRVWHLEERPTTGRNPKGYLTSCWLNRAVPGARSLLARGIVASLLQDLRRFPHGRQVNYARQTLNPTKLLRAAGSRRSSKDIFSDWSAQASATAKPSPETSSDRAHMES